MHLSHYLQRKIIVLYQANKTQRTSENLSQLALALLLLHNYMNRR